MVADEVSGLFGLLLALVREAGVNILTGFILWCVPGVVAVFHCVVGDVGFGLAVADEDEVDGEWHRIFIGYLGVL